MGKFRSPRVVPRERVRSPKFESRQVKLLRDGCACVARVKLGMRNVHRVHVTDIWSWYRVELRVGDHLGRSEELVSRCVECDLAEPESLASLGGSAPGVVDGILSSEVSPSSIVSSNWYSKPYLFLQTTSFDQKSHQEMTIKHSNYIQTVPFLCTERACVVFSRFRNSSGKIFCANGSVVSMKDQREYYFWVS